MSGKELQGMLNPMMKRLLLGLMLLVTATAANAEWTQSGESDELIAYIDIATIRRNGNFFKLWDLRDYKTVQTVSGVSYLSDKGQSEYDCKEERKRILAFSMFSGQMGKGKVVYDNSNVRGEWSPISPGSVDETLWKTACGKK